MIITGLTVVALMSIGILSLKKAFNIHGKKNLHTQLQDIFANKTNGNTWTFVSVFNLVVSVIIIVIFVAHFFSYKRHQRDPCQAMTIKDTIRKAIAKKLYIVIPFTTALLQILTVSLSLFTSASLAARPKAPEFMVVGACEEEICINDKTNKFFKEGDICHFENFRCKLF